MFDMFCIVGADEFTSMTSHVVAALTFCVEVVATVWPRQLAGERRKQVVERPGDDHVEENAANKGNHQHAQTQPYNGQ